MIGKYNEKLLDWRHIMRHFLAGTNPDEPLSGLIHYLRLNNDDVAALCDTTPRTVRRWLAGDFPALVPGYLMARCGFLLAPGWHGYRVTDDGLLVRGGRRGSMTEAQAMEIAFYADMKRADGRRFADLMRENDRLRARLLKTETLARLPTNVRLFPGVSADSIFKQQNGV